MEYWVSDWSDVLSFRICCVIQKFVRGSDLPLFALLQYSITPDPRRILYFFPSVKPFFFLNRRHSFWELANTVIEGNCLVLNPIALHPFGKCLSQVT